MVIKLIQIYQVGLSTSLSSSSVFIKFIVFIKSTHQVLMNLMNRQHGWLNGSRSRCSRARSSRSRCSRDGVGGGGGVRACVRARVCVVVVVCGHTTPQRHNRTHARTHARTHKHRHRHHRHFALGVVRALFPGWRWRGWRCVCARVCARVAVVLCGHAHTRARARTHTHTHTHAAAAIASRSTSFVRCLHGGCGGGGGVCARACVRVCVRLWCCVAAQHFNHDAVVAPCDCALALSKALASPISPNSSSSP